MTRIDPNDDARLPDASRLVDALALAAVVVALVVVARDTLPAVKS